jgi:serine protease Do
VVHFIRSLFTAGASAVLIAVLVPAASVQVRASGFSDFTDLYEKQGPTVVAISVTQLIRHPGNMRLPENHPPIDPRHGFGQTPREVPREIEQRSEASGFIITPDGFLITNAHVVEAANEVNVKLTDKREFAAKVIGVDKLTDIALLKIDATGLPTVTIGDPDKLRVGEWVVTIGKPFGLENSMTAGIVSAKGRDLPDEDLVPFIQMDAAVNPGNSGGPLLNLKGEVVGITSMIYSESGGFMGISFAIPIDIAMAAVAQLKDKGRVTRGRIGVEIAEVTSDLGESFGLAKPAGALVNSVEKDEPADKAGIEPGDIILAVDSRVVQGAAELPRIITAVKPGTRVTLLVWRKGAQREVAVTVAELKDADTLNAARRGEPVPKEKAKPNRIGLVLSDLSDAKKKEMGIPNGVLVEELTDVVRGNVRPGDVILAVVTRGQTTAANTVGQVNALLLTLAKGGAVTLRLQRGTQEFYASLRVTGDD